MHRCASPRCGARTAHITFDDKRAWLDAKRTSTELRIGRMVRRLGEMVADLEKKAGRGLLAATRVNERAIIVNDVKMAWVATSRVSWLDAAVTRYTDEERSVVASYAEAA